ncbi:MAG: sigma-70 family RNA polymerase sigma factor [Anaerolineaceae bacterium]|nr:sigma-70 family RNA polymerase sigma factor [Anaerolineaceae bacterium]
MEQELTDSTDAELIKQASSGDSEAFSALYARYVERIYNYVYYRTSNTNDAEDLTARVFHRAYKHISNYKEKGYPFSAWLYRIAHNLVANWYRDNKRKQEIPLDDSLPLISNKNHPERSVIRLEERESLMEAIKKLPVERQELLILKFVEPLTNAEIAMIMGRSEGAIKSLYHRTLNSLRDLLTEETF